MYCKWRQLREAVDPVGRQKEDYIILSFLEPQSRITTRMIGDTEVVFNVTEYSMSSRITYVATVYNPELLNGTMMVVCSGQSHTIEIPGRSKFNITNKGYYNVYEFISYLLQVYFVDTGLVPRGSSNTSELIIQSIINENARNIFYQISPSNNFTTWTSPITLTAPNNIVFFQCQYNSTFNLGKSRKFV